MSFFLFAGFYFLKFAITKRQVMLGISLGVLHCVLCMSVKSWNRPLTELSQDDKRKTKFLLSA